MWTAFPPSDYYRPSAPPRAISGRRAFPADPPGGRVRGGGCEVVPTFTAFRSSGEAASFAPAASPRLRRSPSPWPPDRQDQSDPGVPAQVSGAHRNPAQIHRVRAGGGLKGLYIAGSSRPPSRLACRTPHRPVVPVRPVVVGAALHPVQSSHRTRLPPAPTAPLRRSGGAGITPAHGSQRLVAHGLSPPSDTTAPRGARCCI
jgi:hypothetical protein